MTAEEQNALNVQAAFGGAAQAVPTEKVETTVVETTETPKAEAPKAETTQVETPKVETPKVETNQKSEEDIEREYISKFLEKKTEGKFKSWDDYEKEVISKPKEVIKEVIKNDFADENIARWNEMAKNGVKITRELLDLETKDFDKMDALQLHIENAKLKEENKRYPENVLAAKIKKQYGINEWFDEDGNEIPDAELSEDALINKQLFKLDAEASKESLNKYKNERVLFKKPDEATLKAMADKQKAEQESWEKYVKEVEIKTEKFTTEVEDEETKAKMTFDFVVPTEVKNEVTSIMNGIKTKGGFFDQYVIKDENGNFKSMDDAKIYQDSVKARIFDKAMAATLKQGIALGKLEAEKRIKNTDFTPTPDGKINTSKGGLEETVRNMPSGSFF